MNAFPLAQVLEQLAPFQPDAVYLFGSANGGLTHPASDIDLALLISQPCDPVELFHTAGKLADLLGKDVDLLDLRQASTVMAKEVLRTGRVVQENNSYRRQVFEMRTLSDYARLNEERRPVLEALGLHV